MSSVLIFCDCRKFGPGSNTGPWVHWHSETQVQHWSPCQENQVSSGDTDTSGHHAAAVARHPVSLDAGINKDNSRYKIQNKSLELSEEQAIREVAEEVSSKEWELDMEISAKQEKFKTSDMDLFTYQEQLEEATNALLWAGEYLESETKNKKYLVSSSGDRDNKTCDNSNSKTTESGDVDLKGSGPYLPMHCRRGGGGKL